MRKLFKMWVLLLVAGVLFMSCSNGSNDSKGSGGSGSQQNAVYYCEMTSNSGVITKMTATFKDDGTFSVTQKMNMGGALNIDVGEVMKGTYTGNAAVDGTITITITDMMDEETEELVPYTDSDATMSITITNGKCTFDGMEFVRQ